MPLESALCRVFDPVGGKSNLDYAGCLRYTTSMRPGGGMADTSVSKTDIERCVGSNPTPGTTEKPTALIQLRNWLRAVGFFASPGVSRGKPRSFVAPGTSWWLRLLVVFGLSHDSTRPFSTPGRFAEKRKPAAQRMPAGLRRGMRQMPRTASESRPSKQ